jgi:hypothetical protein
MSRRQIRLFGTLLKQSSMTKFPRDLSTSHRKLTVSAISQLGIHSLSDTIHQNQFTVSGIKRLTGYHR